METAETLRRRIASVQDLQLVVRTMKALAAVSIRQYERAVQSLAEYYRTIELGLHIVLRHHADIVTGAERTQGTHLIAIVFGSDQGMCGSFNEQVAAFALAQMDTGTSPFPKEQRTVLALGSRVAVRLDDTVPPETVFATPGSASGLTPTVEDLLLEIDHWQTQHHVGQILLFYNRTSSGSTFRPHSHRLLPLGKAWLDSLLQRQWPSRILPTFTMDPDRLFSALIHQYLFVSLYRAMAESLASENASRLDAMQSAEKNIDEHLAALNALFHQQRQTTITEELLDIVSGFEALSGEHRP